MTNNECFACASRPLDLSKETPHNWLRPRALCRRHYKVCTLPSGELVGDFMKRWTHDFSLEGNDLDFFINPVTVEGYKGWCDFLAGGVVVFEELFPSKSYFEFWTQHAILGRLDLFDLLYTLYLRRTESAGDLVAALDAKSLGDLDLVHHAWHQQGQIAQMLLEKGQTLITSPDEIPNLYSRLDFNPAFDSVSQKAFIPVLLDLARNRFANLAS